MRGQGDDAEAGSRTRRARRGEKGRLRKLRETVYELIVLSLYCSGQSLHAVRPTLTPVKVPPCAGLCAVAARGAHGRVAPRQIFRALSSQQLQWSVQHTPLHGLSRCTPALEPRPHVSSPSCDLLANFVDPVNSPATSPCAGPAALHVLLGRRSGLASVHRLAGWRDQVADERVEQGPIDSGAEGRRRSCAERSAPCRTNGEHTLLPTGVETLASRCGRLHLVAVHPPVLDLDSQPSRSTARPPRIHSMLTASCTPHRESTRRRTSSRTASRSASRRARTSVFTTRTRGQSPVHSPCSLPCRTDRGPAAQ